jgi:hypothetical protein
LAPQKGIIAIKEHDDFSRFAMLGDSCEQIFQRKYIFAIYDNCDFIFWNFIFLNILCNGLSSFIRRGVINVHHMIVLILLHENRVKISEGQSAFEVVVRRDDNAKRQLVFYVFADLIFFLIAFFLDLEDFLDSLAFLFKVRVILLVFGLLKVDFALEINIVGNLKQMSGELKLVHVVFDLKIFEHKLFNDEAFEIVPIFFSI